MFGMGFGELLLIAVAALVLVGPKRLPEVMRQAGKFFVHIRRTANDVRSTFDQVVREAENEIRREEAEQLKALLTGTPAPKKATDAASTASTHPGHDPHLNPHDPHLNPHHDPHLNPHHGPDGSKAYDPATPGTHDASWHPVASTTLPSTPAPGVDPSAEPKPVSPTDPNATPKGV